MMEINLTTSKSKKGFEALSNSTLVTSTGSEKTCQNLETRKHPMLKPLVHYISIGWACDQRQLPQDQSPYQNFRKGLYVDQDIEDEGSRPVTGELGPPVLRSNKDPSYSYSSRKQFMEYSTLHSNHDVPYQERGHCAAWPVCSNIEQCVYVSDINSTENLVEMVEGVSFTFQL